MPKETNQQKDKDKTRERIWKIRDLIQDLEDIKNKIINFYQSQNISEGLELLITDAKEVYFNINAAWEMLDATSSDDEKYAESSDDFLKLAKNRLAKCSSELKMFADEGLHLNSQLIDCFEKSWNGIYTELEPFLFKKKINPPSKSVIKINQREYQLPCSICGKIAVTFCIDIPQFSKEESLICSGIVHRASIDLSAAEKIFSWLEQNQISQVHSYLKANSVVFEEGIDAYCPECDKIYCGNHYNTREEWDEGFYDCTYGTCPQGHTRIIHD